MIDRVRIVLACLAMLSGACAHSPPPDLSIDPTRPYDGPPIRHATTRGDHALSVVAPTGGWDLLGEHIDRRPRDARVFLTLIRPNPEEMQTQALARFDVTPGVPADEPLAVYVRVVDFGASPDDARFRLAAAIDPVR